MKYITNIILFSIIAFSFSACMDSNGNGNQNSMNTTPCDTVKVYEEIPPKKDIWSDSNLFLKTLGDVEGKVIADIGTGNAVFPCLLVKGNPKPKKVIAIDIDPKVIKELNQTKKLPELKNFANLLEPRLCTPDDPKLQKEEADIVMFINVYMFFSNHVKYLKNLRKGIAEGGKLVIFDYKKRDLNMELDPTGKIPLFEVEKHLRDAGFKDIQSDDTSLQHMYIITAIR